MGTTKIDIKKVRSANYNLPSMISSLSAQKKVVSMMKWRIPSEIQDRRNIRERLQTILREIEKSEQQLNEIYKVTGSAVTQYMNLEDRLTANASRFE